MKTVTLALVGLTSAHVASAQVVQSVRGSPDHFGPGFTNLYETRVEFRLLRPGNAVLLWVKPTGEVDLFAAESGTAAICYVFDSLLRAMTLNHTTRLSLPQQAQMTLLSLFALLDRADVSSARAPAAPPCLAPAPRAPVAAAMSLRDSRGLRNLS